MAFQKPTVKPIIASLENISIYLRSTKKFGKTTLFRDTVMAKYNDPTKGLLIGCGNEFGYKMLDNLNSTQVNSWAELKELVDWLIEKKGIEHDIKIVGFDTGDELVLLADKETIKISNAENPNKRVKSIKAAMGGFTAGEKYSANDVIKPLITRLQLAGFGVWVIAHTSFKTIKEKGSLEEDGYMQLTSNLGKDYESAFGDIFDVTLTGVIDRQFDEVDKNGKTKKYTTDTVRKLYFRDTPLIDAGGRFAYGAVPEYMVFDKPNMGAEFVKVVEDGIKNSASGATITSEYKPTSSIKPMSKSQDAVEDIIEDTTEEPTESVVDVDEDIDLFSEEDETEAPINRDDLAKEVKSKFGSLKDAELKNTVKAIISEGGGLAKCTIEQLQKAMEVMS